jgi:hypothetical protein
MHLKNAFGPTANWHIWPYKVTFEYESNSLDNRNRLGFLGHVPKCLRIQSRLGRIELGVSTDPKGVSVRQIC